MRHAQGKIAVTALIIFLNLVFLTGCSKKKKHCERKARNIELSVASPIRSIDPRVGSERPSSVIVRMLFEGLMRKDDQGGTALGLAESYEISENQKIYTFYLRSSHWSNGDPLTAYDFEYAWKKSVDPSCAQPGAFTFYPIKNVPLCLEGKLPPESIGVKALDDHILVVELEHPAPYFLELTALTTYSPINSTIAKKKSNWAKYSSNAFTCCGPFRIARWVKGKEMVLEKNPYYWEAECVQVPGIRLRVIQNEVTQQSLFDHGKIDWIGDPLNPISHDVLRRDAVEGEDLEKVETSGLYWYFVNTEEYPLNNKNIRQALARSIDRKAIVQHVLLGYGKPASRLLDSKGFGLKPPFFDDGDLAKARSHFARGLLELEIDEKKFPPLTLSYSNDSVHARIAQCVQQQWQNALGIRVLLDPMDKPRLFNQVVKGDYQLASFMWVSWLADPIYLLETFRSNLYSANMSRWENPEFKSLLEDSNRELNVDARKVLLLRAEELLFEEMPVIPICFGTAFYKKSPYLKNIQVSPLMEITFNNAILIEGRR